MTKRKNNQWGAAVLTRDMLMDTLAEFYHNIIKPEMASKKDLEALVTKKDAKKFATKIDLNKLAGKVDKLEIKMDGLESKMDGLVTKKEFHEALWETESRLEKQIKGNELLITNIEISLTDSVVDHEKRIKKLEGYQVHPS